VKAGEEFFLNYGGDHWFEDRGISVLKGDKDKEIEETNPIPKETLLKEGFCLSDVYVAESREIALGGYGLFARRAFKKGEIVTVSPVLALPRSEVEELEYVMRIDLFRYITL